MSEKPSIDAIFSEAVETDSADLRQAYLDRACGADAELRRQLERLLLAHFRGGSIVDSPAHAYYATVAHPPLELPGTQIGPYKLIEEIGEGGMGLVYMAAQKEPVRRKVALKIIKPGMDTREVIARFAAEEQALALMDHPNIAKVLDAGTTESGRPFFVMELVNGVTLTQYCDDNNLTAQQRLELFVLVCHAVQHAHQKGIIHRDIKPSNILVTMHDGVPVPKIIDFGIAKAINQQLTANTVYTSHGQMIGTPLYMSPEQAEHSGLDIDTRSDIYSLGVLLYELLTGSTPFDGEQLKDVGYEEVRRLIREQEPPRPSTRISTLGKAATTASERRRTNPVELSNSLRHELDWIVMKALEKDRTRRYESANDFARDIQRYLHDEPVEACPPSTVYRLRKFTRRHQAAVIATTAVSLALILGAGVAAGQAYRATKAEKYAEEQLQIAQDQERLAKQQTQLAKKQKKLAEEAAEREATLRAQAESARQQADAVTKFLVDAFRSPDPTRDGRAITVAEMLDQAVTRVEQEFAQDALLRAKLLGAIGETYFGLGLNQKALPLIEQARDLLHDTLGADHPETLSRASDVALCYLTARRLKDALALFQETLERQRAVLASNHGDTLITMHNLAEALLNAGRREEALALYEQTLKLTKTKLGPDNPLTLTTMNNLARVYGSTRRWDEALPLYEQTLALTRTKLGPDNPLTLTTMCNLAGAYGSTRRWDEALPLYEQTLERMKATFGPNHPKTLVTMHNLCVAYKMSGRREEELALLEQALEMTKTNRGPNHPHALALMQNLGAMHGAMGRLDDAIALLEETLKLGKAALAPDHPNVLNTMNCLAVAYGNAGRADEAIAMLEETVELSKAKLGPDDAGTLLSMRNLAEGYFATGRRDEAMTLATQTLSLEKSKLGEIDHQTLNIIQTLINYYEAAGRLEVALPLYAARIQSDPDNPKWYIQRAEAWTLAREWDKAEQDLRKAIALEPADTNLWFELCLVHLSAGDAAAYRRVCHDLVRHYLESPTPPFPGWKVTWCCRMAPIDDEDFQHAVRLVRESLAANPTDPCIRHELACILYRQGDAQEPAMLLQEVWDGEPWIRPWAGWWLAMAHARLGDVAAAKQYLSQAIELSPEVTKNNRWAILEYDLLRREAQALVDEADTDDSPAEDGGAR